MQGGKKEKEDRCSSPPLPITWYFVETVLFPLPLSCWLYSKPDGPNSYSSLGRWHNFENENWEKSCRSGNQRIVTLPMKCLAMYFLNRRAECLECTHHSLEWNWITVCVLTSQWHGRERGFEHKCSAKNGLAPPRWIKVNATRASVMGKRLVDGVTHNGEPTAIRSRSTLVLGLYLMWDVLGRLWVKVTNRLYIPHIIMYV